MGSIMFDSLRYARRLKDVGVPESHAETQAELMAEAFGFYIDNLVTKDHLDVRFNELETRMSERFAEVDKGFAEVDKQFVQLESRMDDRFAQVDRGFAQVDKQFVQLELTITDRFEARFSRLERVNGLHSWMLGLVVVATVIPLIERLLALV